LNCSGGVASRGTGRAIAGKPEIGSSCHANTVAADAPFDALRLLECLACFAVLAMSLFSR
jgi:hypothetical protein